MKSLAKGFTALGLMATPMSGSALAEDPANVQVRTVSASEAHNVNFANAAQGKHVELIHGSGFSSLKVDIIKQTLENAGCPSSSRVLGNRDRMMVLVDNQKVISTNDMGEATGEAIEHCVPGQS